MSTTQELPSQLQYWTNDHSLSWCDHWIYRYDDVGGRVSQPAKYRFLPAHHDQMVIPWGLAKMDNGEVAVAGVASPAL